MSAYKPVGNNKEAHLHNMAYIGLQGARLSVVGFVVGMPLMAWSEGVLDSDGYFNFISNGFEKHSVVASVLFALCTVFIGGKLHHVAPNDWRGNAFWWKAGILTFCHVLTKAGSRFAGIAWLLHGEYTSGMAVVLLLVSQAGGMLTVRNDEFHQFHLVAATCWIASSILYFLLFAINSAIQSSHAFWVALVLAVVSAIVFLVLVCIYGLQDSTERRKAAGAMEFICAWMILACDWVLIGSLKIKI